MGMGMGMDWREGKGYWGLGVGVFGRYVWVGIRGWMVWMRVIRGTRAVADEHGGKDPLRFIYLNFKTPRRCLKCLTPSARGNNHPSHNPDINYLTPSLPSSHYNFSEPPTTAFQFTNPSLVVPEILVPLALSPPLPLSTLTTTGPVWPLNGTEKCVIPAAVAW